MKIATTLAALVFAVAPGMSLANCRGDHVEETAASCLPGLVWDAAKGTCVGKPTS
jgi:hypothetical protein